MKLRTSYPSIVSLHFPIYSWGMTIMLFSLISCEPIFDFGTEHDPCPVEPFLFDGRYHVSDTCNSVPGNSDYIIQIKMNELQSSLGCTWEITNLFNTADTTIATFISDSELNILEGYFYELWWEIRASIVKENNKITIEAKLSTYKPGGIPDSIRLCIIKGQKI